MSTHNKDWWKEISWAAEVETLPGFAETKELLLDQDADVIEALPDEAFFNQLHDKIMARVEVAAIKPPAPKIWRRYQRWLKGSVASMALLAILFTSLGLKNNTNLSSEDLSLQMVLSEPMDMEDSILNFKSHDDYLQDFAQENFDDVKTALLIARR